jgi:3-oxoacyl-[acyl-carrier-protein] synthase III
MLARTAHRRARDVQSSRHPPASLTVDAALEAIGDAGLTPADIDGVATWAGAVAATPGFSSVGVWNIKEALGLEQRWFNGGSEAARTTWRLLFGVRRDRLPA